ncbi:MAG TPA: type III restriction endonuclease subunit R, partial [bacterium]|nr:type III restriction endonuclease subunit R [bacterium]
GYLLLGKDWLETFKAWKKKDPQMPPPVMITVANRTETAARIKYSFDHKKIKIEELCDPDKTLHIDSKVLDMAEAQEEPLAELDLGDSVEEDDGSEKKGSKKEQAEFLRQRVDTVGQPGKPGEKVQNVISVSMLSEGWDAKTVTHIMGLRAFSSQLLCEQVVGRGLRRTSYEVNEQSGLFEPEYVNIFGVPFTFLPHESQDDGPPPPPPSPKTRIEPVKEKRQFEIKWPNIIRVEHTYKPTLTLDMDGVKPITLNANDTRNLAEIAPIIEGKPDTSKITTIALEDLGRRFRMQKIIFEAARDVYDRMKDNWKGNREYLLGQVVGIVEKFITSKKLRISPSIYEEEDVRKRILITLNIAKIVQHIEESIRFGNTESITPVYDSVKPIRSTADMATWYTGKPCVPSLKSHVNFCINDSTW